jgi:polyisoprenoid-binding protein YceI
MCIRFLLLLPLLACATSKESGTYSVAPAVEAPQSSQEASTPPHSASRIEIQGELSFISVKNGDTPVAGTLVGFSGSAAVGAGEEGLMSLDGVLEIPLAGLSTGLPIRDDRIRDSFFHIQEVPTARFTLERMQHPKPGTAGMWIEGRLEIGAFSQPVRGHFRATSNADGSLSLESGEAMVLSISQLGMGERLTALMSLCGHKSIDDSVEVRATGSIRFVQADSSEESPAPQ